jgi:hypothetical protein
LRSASNVAPVPRKPFTGKNANNQSLSRTSVTGRMPRWEQSRPQIT